MEAEGGGGRPGWQGARGRQGAGGRQGVHTISLRPAWKSCFSRRRVYSLRASAHSRSVAFSGSRSERSASERSSTSDCVATKASAPYWPSISICRRNCSPSRSLAVLSLTARTMFETIHTASASLSFRLTTPSRAELSSCTPGASTSTAPVLSTSHRRE